MSYSEAFSPSYMTARERFRTASSSLGFRHTAYPIDQPDPTGEELTIDVVICNSHISRRVVVISSGLHGVEGFLGSAIQLALLQEKELIRSALSSEITVILIHALNPYGFAWRRRWNENNIDLNRNFLLPEEDFQGSPKEYPKFDSFLNPTTPPSRAELYILKAIWLVLRYGMLKMRNTLPVGQYDFPKGLFFGGHFPSATQLILADNLPKWIGGSSEEVLHIDFHTGLGKFGAYKLLLDVPTTSESYIRLTQHFGANAVESINPGGVSYKIRGGLRTWCQHLLTGCRYDLLTAEFGTYSTIQVLKALRDENRAYWWGKEHQNYEWTKHRLVEMFLPRSRKWQEQCVVQGLNICKQAFSY